MAEKTSHWLGALFVLLVLSGLLYQQHQPLLQDMNHKVIEGWGDGIKLYTNLWYHTKHDSSSSHFEGMNYPFGEHVIPGDCQPVLSNSMRFLETKGLAVAEYSIAIQHGFMFFSILLGGLFIYLILRKFQLPYWWAGITAIGITILSPQMERLFAHLNLSYIFVIPGLFYLVLLQETKKTVWWAVLTGLFITLVSGLHFYYFAITMSFLGLYYTFVFLRKIQLKRWLILLPYPLFSLGIPLGFYSYWLLINDPVKDRMEYPFGFFVYLSNWSGIFTSQKLPWFQWVKAQGLPLGYCQDEGQAYIGFFALLSILTSIIMYFLQRKSRTTKVLSIPQKSLLRIVAATTLLLFFSMGIPFIWQPEWLEFAGPLKQFRSLGRYAWLFYYAINISGAVLLWEGVKSGSSFRKYSILLPISAILLIEGFFFMHHRSYEALAIDELQDDAGFQFLPINYEEYQAILPIPYFNIGGQNCMSNKGFSNQKGNIMAAQTGLPVTSAMLTRNSISQTLKQFQLVNKPYRIPIIFKDYPNDKPLIMLWFNQMRADDLAKYQHLRTDAHMLYERKDWKLFELPLEKWRNQLRKEIQGVENRYYARRDSMIQRDIFETQDSKTGFVYLSYNDSGHAGIKNGGLSIPVQHTTTLWEGQLSEVAKDSMIEFSVWYDYTVQESNDVTFVVEQRDTDGAITKLATKNLNGDDYFLNEYLWGWIHIDFPMPDPTHQIIIRLEQNNRHKAHLHIDELLIRPKSLQLYQKTATEIRENNKWYPFSLIVE